uniref:molybdopterin-dependent oxidoreductase n=1 Tax=uncultured Caulobacter sp. TaxID=158749 RepID=UPI0025E99046|nr:molybdopterin-dependent oxidoreductase [uncultured Caulobacter sp.]
MRLMLAAFAALALHGAAFAQDLKVTVAGRDAVTLSRADLAALPRAKAMIKVKGADVTYEGVRLDAVLAQAGVVHGDRLMGRYLNQVVIARAADGFFSLLSLAETDPAYRANPVVVADTVNGHKLDAREGPYRLVVDGDLRPSRAPRQVVSIEVRPAF